MVLRLSDHDRGFLEALIDGEGSLLANRHDGRINCRVSIASNSLDLLHRAQRIVGAGYMVEKTVRAGYHANYELRFSEGILREMLPLLEFTVVEKERRRVAMVKYLKVTAEMKNRHEAERDAAREALWQVIVATSTNPRLKT